MTYGHEPYQEGAMRPRQYTITAKDVQLHAVYVCQKHLGLRD